MNIKLSLPPVLLRWWPALLVMAAIFFFSSLPSNEIPNLGPFDFSVKKLAHMLGYAFLAQAYLYGLSREKHRSILFAWILTILYAMTDEYHQSFVPGRSPRWFDVGIDSLGSLIGLLPSIINRTSRFWDGIRRRAPDL